MRTPPVCNEHGVTDKALAARWRILDATDVVISPTTRVARSQFVLSELETTMLLSCATTYQHVLNKGEVEKQTRRDTWRSAPLSSAVNTLMNVGDALPSVWSNSFCFIRSC